MSRILPSTLIQQQSFNPDWVISDDIIPTGVVLSCQFTTTENNPIYLDSLSVSGGGLSVVFSQGGIVCASVTTQQSGIIIPMEVSGSVLSATVETGVIPTTNFVKNFSNAIVSSSYINTVATSTRTPNKLTITQDNEITEYTLINDLELDVDSTLDVETSVNGKELTISMSGENYLNFTHLGDTVIFPSTEISTINGIKAKNGVIKINIYNDGSLIPVSQKSPNWIVLENSEDIKFCPGFVDTLDGYIAPSTHIGYHPLDDAYTEEGRNTSLLLTAEYGGFGLSEKIELMEVDENIDPKEDKE